MGATGLAVTITTVGERTTAPRSVLRRALRDGLVASGLLFAAYLFVVVAPRAATVGFDAFAYWSVDVSSPYGLTAGRLGAFPYTPVAVRLFDPVSILPFWQFLWLWEAVLIATVVWLGGGVLGTLAILAFPPVALELYHGNIHLLIAAASVLGFRYPAAWALPLLTKVTPGVGIVWFLVRREWRSLAIALGVTGVIVLVSVAVDAPLWIDWLRSVTATASGSAALGQTAIAVPLWLRLPAALGLVAWGGLTDRRWTVPVATTLALPVLWPSGLAVLAALVPIAHSGAGASETSRTGSSRIGNLADSR